MILWTIQTETAWRAFRAKGVLRGIRSRVPTEPGWADSYAWMARQMTRRIGPPPSAKSYPVWAWFQYNGASRPKPDLRCSALLSRGKRGVRIEFECPDQLVLLSDFELWHCVLCYSMLDESEAESERFDEELKQRGISMPFPRPLPDPELHRRIEQSWERIFDLDWDADGWCHERAVKSIQATVWQLTVDQVRRETHFTAR
jgi:hypothetical protein